MGGVARVASGAGKLVSVCHAFAMNRGDNTWMAFGAVIEAQLVQGLIGLRDVHRVGSVAMGVVDKA